MTYGVKEINKEIEDTKGSFLHSCSISGIIGVVDILWEKVRT